MTLDNASGGIELGQLDYSQKLRTVLPKKKNPNVRFSS